MPYRLLKDGTVECDTVKELRALQNGESEEREVDSRPAECESRSPAGKESHYAAFWAELEDRGKAVLRALAIKPNEQMRAEDLAAAIGIQTAKLPAPMIHLRGVAKRADIPSPVVRTKRMEDNKLRSRYQLHKKAWEALKQELKPT